MREITPADIEDLAVGAALLGTGGGGDPHVGKLMAQRALEANGPVELLDPTEVPADDLVVSTSMMGAPTVGYEKIMEGREAIRALQRAAEELDADVDATVPAECGGGNSTIPFVVAANEGIPVVDGDGMGRAFPELHQVTFNVYGVDATPSVLADEHGNRLVFETVDNASVEPFARAATIEMGGRAGLADYPMSGRQLRDVVIPGTISLGIDIGDAIRNPGEQDPIEGVKAVTGASNYGRAVELFAGKITDVERRTQEGFAVGTVSLDGLDGYDGQQAAIEFQNENLIVRRDGTVVATVPDLIVVLEEETGRPVTTERLRYGYRVTVLGIPAPEIMRTEAALEVWGPRYFEYDVEYVELERRFPEYYRDHGVPDGKEHLL
ncbi:MAG: DUF917 domain-containing protein [Halobacteriales archaeon]|nr:DUF917 domain-containing protein [Halobacteriales archaeon]